MIDLLLSEMEEIQTQYKIILKNAAKDFLKKDTVAILDEINVFWHTNKRFAECFFSYISRPYQTYFFTAATMLDVDDNEHYPFLCLGKYHIWDDPIYSLMQMITDLSDDMIAEELKNQIFDVINDDIKIIDTLGDKIFVVPVRILLGHDLDVLSNKAMQMFFSLFNNPPKSVKEYSDRFKTINDIDLELIDDVKDMIILNSEDDNSKSLVEKFCYYKSNTFLPYKEETDATIFMITIIGFLMQALDIVSICAIYRMVPYVRNDVIYRYISIIFYNFENRLHLNICFFKSYISHILYKSFDKKRYSKIELDDFIERLYCKKFEEALFEKINIDGDYIIKLPVSRIVELIDEQFHVCFD